MDKSNGEPVFLYFAVRTPQGYKGRLGGFTNDKEAAALYLEDSAAATINGHKDWSYEPVQVVPA